MKFGILAGLVMIFAGLVAGCGSNGASSTVTGKVADGYLVNATVFLDKNGNYQLDAGEPSTTTDAGGAYTLMVDSTDVGKYPIVAIATQGVTKDLDTGTTVTASYLLSMPKGSVSGIVNSNFISPLSSQLREMMETGQYATIGLAMDALRAKLGMPAGTNVMEDYMAANHVGMHTAAQTIASIMAGQMAQVMVPGSIGSGVQVNRYRGMMGSIFSNISSMRSANPPMSNTDLIGRINISLINMPVAAPGLPYRNMSSAFRGGMMGTRNGGMGL